MALTRFSFIAAGVVVCLRIVHAAPRPAQGSIDAVRFLCALNLGLERMVNGMGETALDLARLAKQGGTIRALVDRAVSVIQTAWRRKAAMIEADKRQHSVATMQYIAHMIRAAHMARRKVRGMFAPKEVPRVVLFQRSTFPAGYIEALGKEAAAAEARGSKGGDNGEGNEGGKSSTMMGEEVPMMKAASASTSVPLLPRLQLGMSGGVGGVGGDHTASLNPNPNVDKRIMRHPYNKVPHSGMSEKAMYDTKAKGNFERDQKIHLQGSRGGVDLRSYGTV